MHKSAGRAQAPGFGKKQAYTVKVHAKIKAQGSRHFNFSHVLADLEDNISCLFKKAS